MTDSSSTFGATQVQGPPGTGGRVELRLRLPAPGPASTSGDGQESAPPAAIYTTLWATADGSWEGEVHVSDAGRVEVLPEAPGEAAPPKWLVDFSAQLVRTTARSVLNGNGAWPRRLTRWRAAPDKPGPNDP